jgi:hypothetical protein
MKWFTRLFTVLALILCVNHGFSAAHQEANECKFILDSLTEIQTIKPGMTRADVLTLFKEEGGLSTRTQRTYVYRKCSYIKVTFKFEAVGAPDRLGESQEDKVVSASEPFLQRMILD